MGAYIKKTIGGVPKGIPLTTDSGQGLPLGAWTSFEDDQPRNGYLKAGTTFNQSDYPALYSMLGTNVIPERFDHDRPSDYEQSTFTTTNTPAQFDGELTFRYNGTLVWVYVNDVQIASAGDVYGSSTTIQSSATISFKKGDNIRFNITVTGQYVRYYKHPMFIKAVIGPIEDSAADQVVQNINNSRSYSTEEVNTGKTWIDGKPIYSVTIEANVTASVTLQNALPADIDNIVTMGCIVKLNTGSYYIIPQFGGTGYTGYVVATPSNRSFQIQISNYTGVYRITIEYTKTTD